MERNYYKAKKLFDDTANRVRSNMNIIKRDDAVWTKVRNRHLKADINELEKVIKNGSGR